MTSLNRSSACGPGARATRRLAASRPIVPRLDVPSGALRRDHLRAARPCRDRCGRQDAGNRRADESNDGASPPDHEGPPRASTLEHPTVLPGTRRRPTQESKGEASRVEARSQEAEATRRTASHPARRRDIRAPRSRRPRRSEGRAVRRLAAGRRGRHRDRAHAVVSSKNVRSRRLLRGPSAVARAAPPRTAGGRLGCPGAAGRLGGAGASSGCVAEDVRDGRRPRQYCPATQPFRCIRRSVR